MGRLTSYNLLVILYTGLPAVGLYLMEQGAYGINIGRTGYPNGVLQAYVLHMAVMFGVYLGVYWVLQGMGMRRSPQVPPRDVSGSRMPSPAIYSTRQFRRLAAVVIATGLIASLFLYFVVGASEVVRGTVGKGEFRSQLGPYGILAYYLRDFLVPMIGAVVAFVYVRCRPKAVDRILLCSSLAAVALYPSLWGYKAATLTRLIPVFLLLVPRASLLSAAALVGMGYGAALLFSMLYDTPTLADAAGFVLVRATSGMGDAMWKVWDDYSSNATLPPYWPTWISGLGGRLGALLGLYDRGADITWYGYDFSALTTLVAKGYALEVDVALSNVTVTVFGEGVIAFGSPGFLLLSVLAGWVLAANRHLLEVGQRRCRPVLAVLAATYFGASTSQWLASGGGTALINLPFVVYYLASHAVLRSLLGWTGIRAHWTVPRPSRLGGPVGSRKREGTRE